MTLWFSRCRDSDAQPPSRAGGAARQRRGTWLSLRRRRILAALLFAASALIIAGQFHPAQTSAARRDPYLQRITLSPSRQPNGVLTIDAPLSSGSYFVDLIFPGDKPPLDFGMAYQETRKHIRIEVRAANQSAPLLAVPNMRTLSDLGDQLDSRSGVELCSFHANSSASLIVSCQLIEGPPWPEEVTIGISHSSAEAKIQVKTPVASLPRPFPLGFSALLAFASVALCWRPPGV